MRQAKKQIQVVKPLRKATAALKAKQREAAGLRRALDMDRNLLRHQSIKLNALENEIWEAKRIAVRNSALFDIHEPAPPYRFPEIKAGCPVRLNITDDARSFSQSDLAAVVADVPLHALLLNIDRDVFEGAVHARVEFAGRKVCYSMTDKAIRLLPRDILIRRVAQELATELARLL